MGRTDYLQDERLRWLRFVLHPTSPRPEVRDWAGLYKFARKQALVGLCSPTRFEGELPPKELLLEWYATESAIRARNAVLNGECDVTVSKLQAGIEACREGKLRYLCMFSDAPVEAFPDVPPITDYDPAFSEFLPWGPFYGVFVKKGTEQTVRETLSDAFLKAYQEETYQALLQTLYVDPLGLCGDEANAYIEAWREASLKALNVE